MHEDTLHHSVPVFQLPQKTNSDEFKKQGVTLRSISRKAYAYAVLLQLLRFIVLLRIALNYWDLKDFYILSPINESSVFLAI